MDWLAIPSAWLELVAIWVSERCEVVGLIAWLVLMVAISFILATNLQSRAGSTVLLVITLLVEVGQLSKATSSLGVTALLSAAAALVVSFFAYRARSDRPEWTTLVAEKYGEVLLSLSLAAAYVLSPFGWLISQDPYQQKRGSYASPLYVATVGSE